jgi:MOSC domain
MRTADQLQAGLDDVRRSPADEGRVELIVRRPAVGEREVVSEGALDLAEGLVGDNWGPRGSRQTEDGTAEAERQLTVMNARAAALFAVDPVRRALAGDQLYLDLDLSGENLPAGTRLELGSAVIEVTALPHTGCAKFLQRFGRDASRLVASDVGRELNLRGINAKVVVPGTVRVGDVVRKAG